MNFKFIFFHVFLLVSFSLFAQPSSWDSRGIGGGGALFAPSISPHNASEIYIQCDMTEVFHTANFGQSWSEIDYSQIISTGGIHPIEFTSDPTILYTVNANFLNGTWYPVKSTDTGQTWNSINDPTFGETWFMSADPNNTNRILVSSYSELFMSTDGGNTFTSVYNNGSDFFISGVFWDGTDIYVGTQIGLVVSIDNGANFSLDATSGIPTGEGFLSFTGTKENGTVRLMGTTALATNLYPGIRPLDIYIYSNLITLEIGATNWESATNGIHSNHYLFFISSSLINNNIFYVGGVDSATNFPVIYKTTDAGLNWTEVFLTANNQNITTGWSGFNGDRNWWYGEIVFGLDVAPNDPNKLIFTDFGFAHVSEDGGATWNQAYVESEDANSSGSATPTGNAYSGNGLENTSSWQLTWIDANNIFASYTDITAIRSTDGGYKWSFDFSGLDYNTVYDVLKHPTTGTLFAAVSSVHDMYQSTYLTDSRIDGGTGGILYSTDNGVTWNMLEDFAMPVIWLALDPNDSNKMYVSVVNSINGGIYKTTDLNNLTSASWSQTTAPTRTEGHPFNVEVLNDGTLVSTWSARRNNGFTNSSGVFISTDEGVTWLDVSMDDDMHYWTKDIYIDPNDINQNTWYVSVHSGWGGAPNDKGGLYKTTDRGQNWNLVFDSYRVESSTVHPTDPNIVYVSTESEGLWYSSNATSVNPDFNRITSYTFQHPIRIFFNPYDLDEVWITSLGNGMKVGSTASLSTDSIEEEITDNIILYPNPTSKAFRINTNKTITRVEIKDLSGKIVSKWNDLRNEFNVEQLKSGLYIVTLWDESMSKLNKLLIIN
ncbi:T9SS type A sorting domain-containing protein [Kordia sp. YSTF-M3]|uniref:T9SS type A sorting domain-containing protein n=1 Tax=Kordia aestuariivivens TaxID=2759037 RepID=A0ABR7Q7Y0_9FLAO|nr:T9SS type A sorting domain-containing protein [Kordia aestuariivivens]MBC8754664.1 T9SS type A sorting domain-containing protein [Kordia aestuariivivens]